MTEANESLSKKALTTEIGQESNYDAEQLKEEIDAGEQEQPPVNLDADYELAQQYETPNHPVETPNREVTQTAANQADFAPAVPHSEVEEGGDPESYRDMAKEVNPRL